MKQVPNHFLLILFVAISLMLNACFRVSQPVDVMALATVAEQGGQKWDRDGGYSAPIPGTDETLVVWADTLFSPTGFSFTGSAGRGKPFVGFDDVPAPRTPLMSNTFRFECGEGQLATKWPMGVAAIPDTNKMLIPYTGFCVGPGVWEFTPRVFGVAEFHTTKNKVVSDVKVISGNPLPSDWVLGSPIFEAGELHLFSGIWPDTTIKKRSITPAGSQLVAQIRKLWSFTGDWSGLRLGISYCKLSEPPRILW